MPLRTLRKSRSVKQSQLALAMKRGQSDVSRIEHCEDLHLSTLRSYVEALGGELRMVAAFPEGDVRLDLAPPPRD